MPDTIVKTTLVDEDDESKVDIEITVSGGHLFIAGGGLDLHLSNRKGGLMLTHGEGGGENPGRPLVWSNTEGRVQWPI